MKVSQPCIQKRRAALGLTDVGFQEGEARRSRRSRVFAGPSASATKEPEEGEHSSASSSDNNDGDLMDWDQTSGGGGGGGSRAEEHETELEADTQFGDQNGADSEANDDGKAKESESSGEDGTDGDSEEEDDSDDGSGGGSVATITQNHNQNKEKRNKQPPDDRNIKQFRQYCEWGERTFVDLNPQQVRGIKLLDILRRNKSPLSAYDDLIGWYLEETGLRIDNEPIGEVPAYLSRKVLMQFLRRRYNMRDKFPFEKQLVLPHSGAKIKVVCLQARHCVWQLLADPRLTDDDFCFYDNDPLAPPPKTTTKVGQLNTGEAYRNAYSEYVDDPSRQMGIGIQWYIDGAVTGQFDNLSVTALRMTLSCFTLDYRKKDHAWAILGFVVNYSAGKSKGRQMFGDTEHDQAVEELLNFENFVPNQDGTNKKTEKAQDFHCQLEAILESYLPLEANGMLWDLHYRGKLYRNLELVFWTVMVKADTDEAEKHCGKYRSRNGNVKHLCRYCHCPNEETDNHLADYEAKTVVSIQELIDAKDKAGLKDISQQYIDNAWYKLRFDPTYGTGIHGACPSEMLHAILLGIFLYVREGFFAQIGPSSMPAKEIDALAQQYGDLFHHNSERNLPGCKFSHGIKQKKKLMAMEYRGVLLLIAAVLRSTKGYEILRSNPHFGNQKLRKDWLRLVELLLEWETFLNQPEMNLEHVQRMEQKNRFIMYLMKKVLRRATGMGLRVMKYHAIIHMANDIILYGVPQEQDTGANESGHKITKVAARLTQKNIRTFEIQTAQRLIEFIIIQWAMAELNGARMWEYYGVFDAVAVDTDEDAFDVELDDEASEFMEQTAENAEDPPEEWIGGTRLEVYWVDLGDDEYGDIEYQPMMGWKAKTKKMWRHPDLATVRYGPEVVNFLLGLQDLMEEAIEQPMYELPICTEHKRNGCTFRGHPDYRGGGPWRDWAMINWGDPDEGGYGDLPCQIWCFVTLRGLPESDAGDSDDEATGIKYGGIYLENLTYAVVECGRWDTNEQEITMCDLFQPFFKDLAAGGRRRFYLADVGAIVAPMCVVPDIGCKGGNRYFDVKGRSEWVELFVSWLEDDDDLDKMD